jgi:hypothetical protein
METLFIGVALYIALVTTIYFLWNFLDNRNNKWLGNNKQVNNIRYYELKSKMSFLLLFPFCY